MPEPWKTHRFAVELDVGRKRVIGETRGLWGIWVDRFGAAILVHLRTGYGVTNCKLPECVEILKALSERLDARPKMWERIEPVSCLPGRESMKGVTKADFAFVMREINRSRRAHGITPHKPADVEREYEKRVLK